MKNSKNSTKGSAKQKSTRPVNGVKTPFGKHEVNENVILVETQFNGKVRKTLVWTDMTQDAYLATIPQTGLKAQGKDRVFPIAKGDSLKAKFRTTNLAVGKLTKRINSSCRGKSWDDFCDEVTTYTKAELLRDAEGKLVKDENGKVIKTGNKVAKYKTISAKTEGLTDREQRILNGVQKIFKSLEAKEAKLQKEAKASEETSKKSGGKGKQTSKKSEKIA